MCLPVVHLRKKASVLFRCLLTAAVIWFFPQTFFAQTPTPAAVPKPIASQHAPPLTAKENSTARASKPLWADLSPTQQQSLNPLAATWSLISDAQKRKWLEVSKNYDTLSPTEQFTMHSRMNEWVALSPQQRAVARLNFGKTKELSKQLTPDEKKAKWETYQALSPEEKAKLAAKASPKPTGAATAVKPVPPQKLAATPKRISPTTEAPAGSPVSTTSETALGAVTPPPGVAN